MSDKLISIFVASHQGSWAFLPLLAVAAYFFYRADKKTPATIVHMILRLFYIIMLVSGVSLLFAYDFPTNVIIKGTLAVLLIGAIEMTLVRAKKKKPSAKGWIAIGLLLAFVVLMGFRVISF